MVLQAETWHDRSDSNVEGKFCLQVNDVSEVQWRERLALVLARAGRSGDAHLWLAVLL
jgi:hypothetical protein